ncbi:MAG: hypothetical protein RL660_1044 [Bacteroidota bacterium]|jgi:opacity protein-like surface antigen
MKKLVTTAIAAVLLAGAAQQAQAQAFDKGVMVASLGYGFPNISKTGMEARAILGYPFATIDAKRGLGPIHAKFEYGMSRRFGFGLSINHENSAVDFSEAGYTYTAKYSSTKFNLRSNIHLGNSDRFDPYFGAGIGYGIRANAGSSTDPNFKPFDYGASFGFEATAGFRFFVTDNIGLYLEVGPAKGWAQFGLNYKLGGGDR